jgi:hypothetical protein
MTKPDDIIVELDKVLDQEKAALLSGNLDELAKLVTKKERLVEALNAADLTVSDPLRQVSDKVSQNKVLLESALDGIRTAARRLAELRRARKTLDTYDRLGRKNRIEEPIETNVEKRA